MEGSYASSQDRVVPTEKVSCDYQQNADAFHDIEGSISLFYAINFRHYSFFFNSLSLLYMGSNPILSKKKARFWRLLHLALSQVAALW